MKTEVRAKTSVNVTVGKRTLCIDAASVSVFPTSTAVRSNAAWVAAIVDADWQCRYSHVTYCDRFPDELAALIRGVLREGNPVEPLIDWVIEFGPANLAAELEAMCG